MALVAGTMLASLALTSAGQDLPFATASQDRKQAYAAAEAGLEYYLFQLSQDNDYWTRCTTWPARARPRRRPVNQHWVEHQPREPDPRRWRDDVRGQVQVHARADPRERQPRASPARPSSTMLNRGIRHVPHPLDRPRQQGRRGASWPRCAARSFLDFIYFTDYETSRPGDLPTETDRTPGRASNCNHAARRPPRQLRDDPVHRATTRSTGPFHTNDNILTLRLARRSAASQDPTTPSRSPATAG